MTVDLHTLTGAYALDAVPPAEVRGFEAHLGRCQPCTHEVHELRATATRLGLAAATDPPPWLKHRVIARIRGPRHSGGVALRSRRRAQTRLFAGAAAVLLVVAIALGLALVENQPVDDEPVTGLPTVVHAADARIVEQDSPAGTLIVVVSRRQNRLVLFTDELTPAPPRRTYQVWTIGRGYRSAGLFTGHETPGLEITGIGDVHQIGITTEPVGGSHQPTNPAIITVDLP